MPIFERSIGSRRRSGHGNGLFRLSLQSILHPPGGGIPEQAMTREEALRAATMGGAYVMFAEDILGSIEAGKLAEITNL
jgi:hypothetical protein